MVRHPNSLANLQRGKKFKPGQSGNPSGVPRGTAKLSCALLRLLRTYPDQNLEGDATTKADELAWVLYQQALAGDLRATDLILKHTNRQLRKTTQTLQAEELSIADLITALGEVGISTVEAARLLAPLGVTLEKLKQLQVEQELEWLKKSKTTLKRMKKHLAPPPQKV